MIGAAPTVTLICVGWCLAQLAYNAVLAAMVAIVPDQISTSQRGTVVGILGVCMPVGQIVGTFLVQLLSENLTLALLVPGVLGVAGVLTLAWVLPDAPLARETLASAPPQPIEPLSRRDFYWAWLSRVFFVMGSIFLQAYQPLLLIDGMGFAAAQGPKLIFRSTLVQAIMMVAWSLIAGRLSDRIGRRKPIAMAGSVIQGLGLWLIAMAPSYTLFLCGVALLGVGHGVYEGVNLALVDRSIARSGASCGQGSRPSQHYQHAAAGDCTVGGSRDSGHEPGEFYAVVSGSGGGPHCGGRPPVTREECALKRFAFRSYTAASNPTCAAADKSPSGKARC